ncbi:hypothetical protein KKF34_05155 [Myxococcota bacterium]|nr:hypothetical protein [Myxococcota bacterium]MBU1380909.1 hypothetical protein [Myxococcota bacterium]MBU1496248.1 hypothetical protein [Myxococcota bacterium]
MNTIVFCGSRATLKKAIRLLEQHGIKFRISHPIRDEGYLRVSLNIADEARRVLSTLSGGRVISSAEAEWFICHACGATLSGGEMYCPSCRTCIGDSHRKSANPAMSSQTNSIAPQSQSLAKISEVEKNNNKIIFHYLPL